MKAKRITTAVLVICVVWLSLSFVMVNHRLSAFEETMGKIIWDIETLEQEAGEAQLAISDLYRMNSSHVNCIALAVQANSESILADQYGRTEQEQDKLYGNDCDYASFYGRLYVPDAGIDVALYYGNSQAITDRQDSANIYMWGTYTGESITDHNNQEFRKLFSVKAGTEGYIQLENGDIINIRCTEVLNGHNTGNELTNESGEPMQGKADYLTYTCRSGWYNIRICLWDRV